MTESSRHPGPARPAILLLLLAAAVPPRVAALEQVTVVTGSPAAWQVDVGGTLDAENTRREADLEGPWSEGFQPNLYLTLTNTGREAVENPRVLVNGHGSWTSIQDVLDEVLLPAMTPEARALSLWAFLARSTYRHPQTWGGQYIDPVLLLNTYGYGECGVSAHLVARLAAATGIEGRLFGADGDAHFVADLRWNGRDHLVDVDRDIVRAWRAGEGLVSPAEFRDDHYLGSTTHIGGPGAPDNSGTYRYYTAIWDGRFQPRDLAAVARSAPAFTLRPGETLHRSWAGTGKFGSYGAGPASHGIPPPRYANGFVRYVPDLADTLWRAGAVGTSGLRSIAEDGLSPAVHLKDPPAPGELDILMVSPCVIVGGSVRLAWSRATDAESLRVDVSRDGADWETVWTATGTGSGVDEISLDAWVDPHDSPWLVDFRVRVRMAAGAGHAANAVGIDSIAVTADFQLNTASLPALSVGTNQVEYRDGHAGTRSVRVTQGWEESGATTPPGVPLAVSPAPGALVASPRPTFDWDAPADPDGDAVVDYQIQVAEADAPGVADGARHVVVAPGLDRYVSLTPSGGQTSWRPFFTGLLTPGAEYAWRVRARDAAGAWGAWCAWSPFTMGGVARPDSLELVIGEGDGAASGLEDAPHAGEVALRWRRAAPGSAVPSAWLVYGSDEQGFTPSTSNLLAAVGDTSCIVVTPWPVNPRQNRAFYRVVARDGAGLTGAPSECVELPHPVVTLRPATKVEAGAAYCFNPSVHPVVRYDLLPRADSLSLVLDEHPGWLAVLPDTLPGDSLAAAGELCGTPSAGDAGAWPVRFVIRDGRGNEARGRFTLRVGETGNFVERIPLAAGWNLVSWPILPGGRTLDEILAGVSGNLLETRGDASPVPAEGAGRWLRMAAADTLVVAGDIVEPRDHVIDLAPGWNLVSFLPFGPDSVGHAFASLGANLRGVMGPGTDSGRAIEVYDPERPGASTLAILSPGRGYFVEVSDAATLRYPVMSAQTATSTSVSLRLSPSSIASTSWCALAGEGITEGGVPAPAGTEVLIYDAGATRAGVTVLDAPGAFAYTPVWADDPATAADEGAAPGDSLFVVVGGKLLEARPVFTGFGARLEASGELGDDPPPVPGGVPRLRFASPLRTGSGADFFVTLPSSGAVRLDIHAVTGRRVRSIAATLAGGAESVLHWDGRDEAGRMAGDGVYFLVLHHPAGSITRKAIAVRG